MSDPVVVVGGSTAGLSVVRGLRTAGFDGGIQVLERELVGPYRRPAISKGLVGGTQSPDDLCIPWPDSLGL
jgi:NADPH-dependent 2,4-dienoyl-CoA reductase/sulfur reductase-like enzyme